MLMTLALPKVRLTQGIETSELQDGFPQKSRLPTALSPHHRRIGRHLVGSRAGKVGGYRGAESPFGRVLVSDTFFVRGMQDV